MAALENLLNQAGADLNLPRSDVTARNVVAEAFQLPTGAVSGYVLASDAKGNAYWVNVSVVGGTTLAGTANEVLVNGTSGTPQTGAMVLTTPQSIGTGSDVTFRSLKLSSLIPDKLIYVDSSNELLSATDITDWIFGTANEIIITDGKDGTITISTPQPIATSSDVTFNNLTLGAKTASRLLSTNGSKQLTSTNLASWVTGTANQVIRTDNGDGTITLSTPQDIATTSGPTFTSLTLVNPLAVASGGTGRATATAKTIPYIDGSGNWQFFTMTDGDLIIGSTGNTPAVAKLTAGSNITITNAAGGITIAASGIGASSITGTANQVLANGTSGSPQTGAITLTLPQNVGTSSTPSFSNLILSSLGSSQYVKSGTGSGFTSVASIPVSDISGISATAPMSYSAGTIALLYSATNLRNNGGSLDTIQDIATASSPTFTGLNLSSTGINTPLNMYNHQVGNTGPVISCQKTRNFLSANIGDTIIEINGIATIGVGSYTGFRIQSLIANTGSPTVTTTLSNLGAGTLTDLIQFSGANLVFPSQTASRFLRTDSSKNLISTAISTSDVPEGSNLYFTNARARSALSGSSNISYNSTTGVIDTVQGIQSSSSPQFQSLYLDATATAGNSLIQLQNSASAGNNLMFYVKNRVGGLNVGELIGQETKYGYNSSGGVFAGFACYTTSNSSTAGAEKATTNFDGIEGGANATLISFVGNSLKFPTVTASSVVAVDSNQYATAANITSGSYSFTVSAASGFASATDITGRYSNILNTITYNGSFTGTSDGSASSLTFDITIPINNTGAWSDNYQAVGTATGSATVSGSTAYVSGSTVTSTNNKISFTYSYAAIPTNGTAVRFNFSLMYTKT